MQGDLLGFLVISGTLTMNVRLSGRVCTRLIDERELVLLDGVESDPIPAVWGWEVLEAAHVAILDSRLLVIGRRWPSLMGAILKRAADQTRHLFLQKAISQLPRVEQRLLALLWSIADRRGVVRADGVWVRMSATHEALARMIGAQRPTVSLGLAHLSEAGLLRSEDDGWLLHPASLDELSNPD